MQIPTLIYLEGVVTGVAIKFYWPAYPTIYFAFAKSVYHTRLIEASCLDSEIGTANYSALLL